MSRRSFITCLTFAIALTLGGALIQGHFSDRWGLPGVLPEAARRLAQVPDAAGDWRLRDKRTLDQRTLDVLHAAGYLYREYEHRETGQTVSVAVIVGPPGPTSVHIPEICYSSQAFDVQSDRRRLNIACDGANHQVWALTFRSVDPSTRSLQVAYGWNGSGRWEAPESPRLEMRMHQALYKIQVAAQLPLGATPSDDPCQAFLSDFLPVLDSALLYSHPTSLRASTGDSPARFRQIQVGPISINSLFIREHSPRRASCTSYSPA